METPRVFILSVNRLVCEAVNVLLRKEGVAPVGMDSDPENALLQIKRLNPEVLLVEGSDEETKGLLMPTLGRLAYDNGKLRIIRMSLSASELHIYHQEQRRLLDSHDLIAAICQNTANP
jgi:chemotaxis response regulator CheB